MIFQASTLLKPVLCPITALTLGMIVGNPKNHIYSLKKCMITLLAYHLNCFVSRSSPFRENALNNTIRKKFNDYNKDVRWVIRVVGDHWAIDFWKRLSAFLSFSCRKLYFRLKLINFKHSCIRKAIIFNIYDSANSLPTTNHSR